MRKKKRLKKKNKNTNKNPTTWLKQLFVVQLLFLFLVGIYIRKQNTHKKKAHSLVCYF